MFDYDARNSRREARMRGDDRQQAGMWSYVPLSSEPAGPPLRPIRNW